MGQAIDTPKTPQPMLPSLFQLYTNNIIQNTLHAIQIDATGTVASEVGSFGYMFRGNALDQSHADTAHAVMNTQGHDLDMLMFDRTVSTNAPGGFTISYTVPPPSPPNGALMLLGNFFDRGNAPLAGSFGMSGPRTRDVLGYWLRGNKHANFADHERGSSAKATPELPVRFFSVAARAKGKPVSFPITLYNAGASEMAYTITQVGSWLGVSGAGSITAAEAASGNADSTLTVTCDPSGLAPKIYQGTIYVAAGGVTRAASVAFRVLP
jgi:hypothetical protein